MTDPTRISDDQHNNAPAVPQGALQVIDAKIASVKAANIGRGGKINSAVSFALGLLEDVREVIAATPAPAPAQGKPFGYFRAEPFGWTDCSEDAEGAIALYEHPAAPAVPQGWVKASDRMPLDGYSDGLREIADELDAVQKDLAGIELQADGNANFYWLMRDGKWIAKIQMNGEMLVDKQVALLEAMLSAGTQIAHCPKCFTCFEVGSGSTEQNPWRDAVIEQLESWHICVPAIHDNSPRLAIKALVNIETKAALDPAVSSEAAALVAGQHNNAPAVPDDILARACNLAGLPYETFLKIKSYLPTAQAGTFQEPAVPQGWRLVPIEPTKEMLDAGLKRKAQARWIDGASVLRARTENLRPAEEIAALQWEAMLAATTAPAPAQEVVLTNRQFDLICQAIDQADTVTMDGDYMLDSDDCIGVVRVMQVLFDISAIRAKEQA